MQRRRLWTITALALALSYIAWVVVVFILVDQTRGRVEQSVWEITQLRLAETQIVELEDQLLDQITGRRTEADWTIAVQDCLNHIDELTNETPRVARAAADLRQVVHEHEAMHALITARGIDNMIGAMAQVRDARRSTDQLLQQTIANIRTATRVDSETLLGLWRQQQLAAVLAIAIALGLALLGIRHVGTIRSLRRAQRDLSEYSRNLDLMATHIDEVFWLATPDERSLLYISPLAAEFLQIPEEDLRSDAHRWLDRAHPDDRDEIQQRIQSREGQPDPSDRDHECRLVLEDGSTRWVWMRSKPVFNEHGTIVARAGVAADITERQTAEQRLREQKELTDSVIDSAAMLVVVLDKNGLIVRFNPACEKLTGYAADDVIGSHFELFLRDDERDAVVDTFGTLKPESFPSRRDNFWVTRNGEMRLISWSNSCIVDANGDVRFVIGTGVDVTEQQIAIEALRGSEERFRQLTESIREVFWLTDWIAREFIYISPTYQAVFGQDPGVALRDFGAPRRMIHPDDVDRIATTSREAIEAGQPYDCEYRIVRPDGQLRWVQVRAFPITDTNGRVYRIAGITDDITARKDAERRAWLHTFVVDNAAEAMFTVSPDGVIVEANRVACARLGYDREHLVGKSMWEIDANVHENEWHRDWARIATESPLTVQTVHRTVTGQMFPVELSIAHFTFEGDALCCVFATDISERKRAVAEIEQARLRERTLYRELNHRVRNNLASLVTLVDVTRRDTNDLTAFAGTIRERIQTMATVHSLLAQSRWAPTRLRDLVVALTPPEHAHRMLLSGDAITIPPRQAAALGIVIHELMTNSVKYGVLGSDAGTLHVTWTLESESAEGTTARIRWLEEGGPTIEHPPAPGGGSSLMDGLTRSDLRGELRLSFPPTGADHMIELNLDAVPDYMQGGTATRLSEPKPDPIELLIDPMP